MSLVLVYNDIWGVLQKAWNEISKTFYSTGQFTLIKPSPVSGIICVCGRPKHVIEILWQSIIFIFIIDIKARVIE